MEHNTTSQWKEKQVAGKLRKDLVSSLQVLGDYEGLLAPPQSVISVANQAAAKAMMFISGLTVGSGYFECIGMTDVPMNCCKQYSSLFKCVESVHISDFFVSFCDCIRPCMSSYVIFTDSQS